jgi:hypothetical protein
VNRQHNAFRANWRFRLVLLVLAAVVPHAGASAQDRNATIDELLQMHHAQRVAHVLRNAGALVGSFDSSFVNVAAGDVARVSPNAALRRFTQYFANVRFLEWDDSTTPRIQVSADGSWAEVVVRKRVRTIPVDTTAMRSVVALEYAWTERWVRRDNGWRLATITSTNAAPTAAASASTTLSDVVRAHDILARARSVLGGDSAIASVATIRFTASCEGPNGAFTTEVASARDGRARFTQQLPTGLYAAGTSLERSWQLSGGIMSDSLDNVTGSVVDAHELQMLAVAPESRYRNPVARGSDEVGETSVDAVRFTDRLGAPVDFYFDVATGVPVGFRAVNHTGRGDASILTVFGDWRMVGAVRLPHRATIMHGSAVYQYRMTASSTEWINDRDFHAPDGEAVNRPAR